MLIKTSLVAAQEEVPPLLFVFDDFEILPKFEQLHEGLIYGPSAGLSFMLLTDNLKTFTTITVATVWKTLLPTLLIS